MFCALLAEARPLIEHWKLIKQTDAQPFAIYQNGCYALVITGIGKSRAAAAVAYGLCWLDVRQPVLINLGIAGHAELPLGSLWAVDKITDADSGRSWYPQLVFNEGMPSAALLSCGRPFTDYLDCSLYDLEASGFFEVACKFTSQELVHCLKVISDNRQHSVAGITPQQVSLWMHAQLDAVIDFIGCIVCGRAQLPVWDEGTYREGLERYHFSVSNAHKLKHLLQVWQLRMPIPFCYETTGATNATQLLNWMEQQLQAQAFSL